MCIVLIKFLHRNSIFLDIKNTWIWSTSQPNGLVVPGASFHLVKSTSDVLGLMEIGQANRAVGSTALNERSSRSHRLVERISFSTCT
jgi:hypothetical protein